MIENANIGGAIEALHDGKKMTRTGWNGHHTIQLQVPDANSKMTQPYVYMTTEAGAVVPWICSQTDLLAQDWCEVA